MRVIAGIYKSRQLKSVKSSLTRPTTDRNKENMFNLLGPYFDGGIVLDLFGGSGALGIEAMSRGCDYLYSVDNQYGAYKTILENINSLKISDAKVLKMDYHKALKFFKQDNIKFDLVLLDPPYGKKMIDDILSYLIKEQLLNDNCIISIEELKDEQFVEHQSLELIKRYNYGITALSIYKYHEMEYTYE